MTDENRAELRRGIEVVVKAAESAIEIKVESHEPASHHRRRAYVTVYQVGTGSPPEPKPLTTAQQLALSVLLGEPDAATTAALCDLLIEQGHEYAVAVAEKARAEERERIAAVCDGCAEACQLGVLSGSDDSRTRRTRQNVYRNIAATARKLT